MKLHILLLSAWAGMAAMAALEGARAAPYVVGDRVFPATPTTDYPFIADAAYASVTRLRQGTPDQATRETDLGFGVEKRITADLGVDLDGAYKRLARGADGNAYGFDNVEATLKYQLFLNDPHEFLLSIGVSREFGGSGAAGVDAEAVSATTPTIYMGKGFGDLPDALKYLRPLAITGVLGYRIPDERNRSTTVGDAATGARSLAIDHTPDQIVAGFALEYSLRYLQGNVAYVGLPPFIGRLTPLVEMKLAAPTGTSFGTPTTGVIAPGLIYSQNGIDFGVEALVPLTRQSGTNVGFIASLHIPFDVFLPVAASTPLFGGERP
jgi:hypothetical protein